MRFQAVSSKIDRLNNNARPQQGEENYTTLEIEGLKQYVQGHRETMA